MVFLFLLLDKHFNLRIALIASLLYIFSPPLFTARSLIFNGSLAETVFFSSVVLLIFFNLIFNKARLKNYILLGVFSGFSLWYSYANILSIITYTIIWFIKDKKFFLDKRYAVYLLFLMIGLIPWFAFNYSNNFTGLGILRNNYNTLCNLTPFYFINKIEGLIFASGWKIFIFDNFLPRRIGNTFNLIYYLVFLASFLFILSSMMSKFFKPFKFQENSFIKEMAIIIYPIIFILIYGLSIHNFESTGYGIIDYRYAVLLSPFIFIIIALFIDKLYSSRNIFASTSGRIIFISLLTIGVLGNGAFVRSRDFTNRWLRMRACNYELIGNVAARRYGMNIIKAKDMFKMIKGDTSLQEAYRGYGQGLGRLIGETKNLANYIKLVDTAGYESFKNEYLYGIGYGIIESISNHKQGIEQCLLSVDKSSINDFDKNRVIFGMLERALVYEHGLLSLKDALEILPLKYHALSYVFYAADACRKGISDNCYSIGNDVEKPYERYRYMGIGGGITSFYSGDQKKILSFFNKFSYDKFKYLMDGVAIYFYKINGFNKEMLKANLPLEWESRRDDFLKAANNFDVIKSFNKNEN